MTYSRVKELARKIESESRKLDKKIKDIEKIKLSITKDLKKNVKELKRKQIEKLQEEKKNITSKVKEMKADLLNTKKEIASEELKRKMEINKKEDKNKASENISKKIMNTAALYNKNSNKELICILDKLKDKDLKKEEEEYLKTIYSSFAYIIKSDIYFFKIYRKYSNKNKIPNEDILEYSNYDISLNKKSYKDLNSLIEIRKKLDDIIIAVVNSIEDFNTAGKIKLSGTEIKKPRYHLIMQALNHSIYHRGRISAMLEQIGYAPFNII
ncbi:DinB family protein [uncultured Brachyspira sp.]|uniref:DinB family protein n=1 Tax=uncultured Brachyspira sp. TaxID=221953 RepID=UPI0025D1F603|nr:DinB family protein [uncultured Brachyspira sp.]